MAAPGAALPEDDTVSTGARPRVIPNRSTQWGSSVYILIGGFGGSGVVSGWSWPPATDEVFAALGVVLVAVLAVRALRCGVVVDGWGFRSRGDVRTHRMSWTQVDRFDSRGWFYREVGVLTVDGRWVPLQYHRRADRCAEVLERARQDEASEADRRTAADAAAAHRATSVDPLARRFLTWRFALAMGGMAALLAALVGLHALSEAAAIGLGLAGVGNAVLLALGRGRR